MVRMTKSSPSSSSSRPLEREEHNFYDSVNYLCDSSYSFLHYQKKRYRYDLSHSGVRGSTSTTEDERYREAFRRAPQRTQWMASTQDIQRWFEISKYLNSIPLSDPSNLHGLDINTVN